MKILFRTLGGWSLIAALIAFVSDATAAAEAGTKFSGTSLGALWRGWGPNSLAALQASMEKRAALGSVWRLLSATLLAWPAYLDFLFLALLLFALGWRRARIEVFAN